MDTVSVLREAAARAELIMDVNPEICCDLRVMQRGIDIIIRHTGTDLSISITVSWLDISLSYTNRLLLVMDTALKALLAEVRQKNTE